MKLTKQDKTEMLITLVEHYVLNGYSINHLVGKPLNYFDYKKVYDILIDLNKDSEQIENIKESNYYKYFNYEN